MHKNYTLVQPDDAVPLVMDSPHSGVDYPADFEYACSLADLRYAEDTHVEKLWQNAPSMGIPLLAANAARTYIDYNRSLDDLDVNMLSDKWPNAINPGEKSSRGFGLIWSNIAEGKPIYATKLSSSAVSKRIEEYYLPYHSQLNELLDSLADRHGGVWHLNQHSMPAAAYARMGFSGDRVLADFVLGTRDGTTCDPEFADLIANVLRGLGYSVSINEPYKGAELVRLHGRPLENRHSLMIEIHRRLYMSELTREVHDGFGVLQKDLDRLSQTLVEYVKHKISRTGE
ncbi:N-formylglutamate amidohydrolase [Undibacterium sp. TS12]|uniref:N-formylglutamate amidohydrolase n=1 Tax=Undibacterium sp. TS12 TaxID=2908202 RepID=UPI001F4C7BD0|nr:N-formylglutamate amidohydrolase [Undibacterium sp. TS12]MCH8620529.1 N-formylglutamate amidohydrolase [Undibacterium sp. TS12]